MTREDPDPAWRRLARWIRYAPDRLLHPLRRSRARRRLESSIPDAAGFLFVCYGNICRSPFAAELLRRHFQKSSTGLARSVSSAGFYPVPDREPPATAVRVARDRDVDLSVHRSRTMGQLAGDRADPESPSTLVFVMTDDQRRQLVRRRVPASRVFLLGDFDPEPVGRRAIPDPFGKPREVFEEVYARLERCVGELTRILTGAADPP